MNSCGRGRCFASDGPPGLRAFEDNMPGEKLRAFVRHLYHPVLAGQAADFSDPPPDSSADRRGAARIAWCRHSRNRREVHNRGVRDLGRPFLPVLPRRLCHIFYEILRLATARLAALQIKRIAARRWGANWKTRIAFQRDLSQNRLNRIMRQARWTAVMAVARHPRKAG
jgi:hypothetical protein